MSKDKCSHCGASLADNLVIDVKSFQCGSDLMLDGLERSHQCICGVNERNKS